MTSSPGKTGTGEKTSPVFLFGMERSGTTLLAMMIGAHPEIAVPLSTTGMWYDFYDRLASRYGNLSTEGDLRLLVDDILAHKRIGMWRASLDRGGIEERCSCGDYGSVVRAFHLEYAGICGKSMWANSDISTLYNMHVANSWFPDALFVHLVRDGRDVALSHRNYPFGAGNIAECADKWRIEVGRNIRMGAMIGPERYCLIRYEDLVLRPEETLERLCGFMGVSYEREMMDYTKTVEARVPPDRLWLWPELGNSPKKSKAFRWKKIMGKAQRAVFDSIAGALLDELGYERSASRRMSVSAYALEFLYFLDRGHRWKRFRKRLGFETRTELERKASLSSQLSGKAKKGRHDKSCRAESRSLVDH